MGQGGGWGVDEVRSLKENMVTHARRLRSKRRIESYSIASEHRIELGTGRNGTQHVFLFLSIGSYM